MREAIAQLVDVVQRMDRRLELVESKLVGLAEPPEAFRLSTAAKRLEVTVPTLRADMKAKGVRPVFIGSRPRIRREDLARLCYLKPSTPPPPPPRVRGKKSKQADSRTESEKLRAALKKTPRSKREI